FCLGSSEMVASGLNACADDWLEVFSAARSATYDSIAASMRCAPLSATIRGEAAAELAAFKNRRFLEIAIADLLGRIDVTETARLMSMLADECIVAGLQAAARIVGSPPQAQDFCVLAMGKLGSNELNLSSDIDLVYLYHATDATAASLPAARIGETLTE